MAGTRLTRVLAFAARPSSSGGILSFYAVHTFMRQSAVSGEITYHVRLQAAAQERLLRRVGVPHLRGSSTICIPYADPAYFGPSAHPAYRTPELWQVLNGQ